MNNEKLILYSLKWIIERDKFNPELRKEMDEDICNKIVELMYPTKSKDDTMESMPKEEIKDEN